MARKCYNFFPQMWKQIGSYDAKCENVFFTLQHSICFIMTINWLVYDSLGFCDTRVLLYHTV